MINHPTILTIKNVSTAAIDYHFYSGWEECGEYKTTGSAKNINRNARYLDTWILLKAIAGGSGTIKDYNKQMPELLRICKIKRSMFYERKNWLIENNLMHEKGGHLFLHKYKYLEPLFGIDTTERYKEPVYYDTTEGNEQRLAEQLYLEGKKRKLNICRLVYNKKMDEQPDVKEAIKRRAIEYGADPEKLEKDSEYFRQSHDKLQVMSYAKDRMEDTFFLTHTFCNANPDLNMSHAGIGRDNGFTVQVRAQKEKPSDGDVMKDGEKKRKKKVRYSCSGAAHFERRLAKKGLIAMKEQRVVVSEWRARKDEEIFHATWSEKREQTIWFKPRGLKIIYNQSLEAKKTA